MPRPRQRLFAPGSGAAPPVLTGRKAQQDVLRNCLADLIAGASPPHDVVLIGPRGNGKTVLLNWFKQVARSAEPATDVIALTPDEAPTPRTLTDLLAPRRGLAKLLPRKVGVSTVGSVEWDTSADTTASLKERLIARCRTKPLAVLIDEAHTLDANDLDRVRPVVVSRITNYYQNRYRELEGRDLLHGAVALAPVFQQTEDISDGQIDTALRAVATSESSRLAIREKLNALGYIWCPPNQTPPVTWQPGIPSLMAYVRQRAESAATPPPPRNRPPGADDEGDCHVGR